MDDFHRQSDSSEELLVGDLDDSMTTPLRSASTNSATRGMGEVFNKMVAQRKKSYESDQDGRRELILDSEEHERTIKQSLQLKDRMDLTNPYSEKLHLHLQSLGSQSTYSEGTLKELSLEKVFQNENFHRGNSSYQKDLLEDTAYSLEKEVQAKGALEKKLRDLQSNLKETKDEKEAIEARYIARVEELELKIEALRKDGGIKNKGTKESMQKLKDVHKAEIAVLEDKVETLEEETAKCKSELLNMELQVEDLRAAHLEVEQENIDLKVELEKRVNMESESRNQLIEAKSNVKQLKHDRDQLSSELYLLKQSIEGGTEQLMETHRIEINALKDEYDQKATDLRAQIKECEARRKEDQMCALQERKAHEEEIQRFVDEHKTGCKGLEETMNSLRQNLDAQLEKSRTAERENVALVREIGTLKDHYEATLENLQQRESELQSERSRSATKLLECSQEHERMIKYLETQHQAEIASLKRSIELNGSNETEAIQALKSEVDRLSTINIEQANEAESLRDQLRDVLNTQELLRDDVAEAQSDLKETTLSLTQLLNCKDTENLEQALERLLEERKRLLERIEDFELHAEQATAPLQSVEDARKEAKELLKQAKETTRSLQFVQSQLSEEKEVKHNLEIELAATRQQLEEMQQQDQSDELAEELKKVRAQLHAAENKVVTNEKEYEQTLLDTVNLRNQERAELEQMYNAKIEEYKIAILNERKVLQDSRTTHKSVPHKSKNRTRGAMAAVSLAVISLAAAATKTALDDVSSMMLPS